MPDKLGPDSTLENLASHAADVKFASGIEERAIIAYERFALEVAMGRGARPEDVVENYGYGRRVLLKALQGAAPPSAPRETQQKFHAGDLVRVADEMPDIMSHFPKGFVAIVTGSYRDLYESHGSWGDGDERQFSLYREHGGGIAWYYAEQLTLLERGRFDLWEQWRNANRAAFEKRMDVRAASPAPEEPSC
jgi:hypothetical protein